MITIEEVIKGFGKETIKTEESISFTNELFQEAIKISMELNTEYHTPQCHKLKDIDRKTGLSIKYKK